MLHYLHGYTYHNCQKKLVKMSLNLYMYFTTMYPINICRTRGSSFMRTPTQLIDMIRIMHTRWLYLASKEYWKILALDKAIGNRC